MSNFVIISSFLQLFYLLIGGFLLSNGTGIVYAAIHGFMSLMLLCIGYYKVTKYKNVSIGMVFGLVAIVYFSMNSMAYLDGKEFVLSNKLWYLFLNFEVFLIILLTFVFTNKKSSFYKKNIVLISDRVLYSALCLLIIFSFFVYKNFQTTYELGVSKRDDSVLLLLFKSYEIFVVFCVCEKKELKYLWLIVVFLFVEAVITGSRFGVFSFIFMVFYFFVINNRLKVEVVAYLAAFSAPMIMVFSLLIWLLAGRVTDTQLAIFHFQMAYRFDLVGFAEALFDRMPSVNINLNYIFDEIYNVFVRPVSHVEGSEYYLNFLINNFDDNYFGSLWDPVDTIFSTGVLLFGCAGFYAIYPIFVWIVSKIYIVFNKMGCKGIMLMYAFFLPFTRIEFELWTFLSGIRNAVICFIIICACCKICGIKAMESNRVY